MSNTKDSVIILIESAGFDILCHQGVYIYPFDCEASSFWSVNVCVKEELIVSTKVQIVFH